MKPDNNSTGRYRFLFIIICLAACYILGTALQTMLSPQKDYWVSVGKRFTKENLPIPANRGNLLASDGQLLAGSIPEFRLYMDYVIIDADSVARVKAQHWRDSAFKHDLDSIATLGFRGEALPSIAAVSKVNMITKTADEEMGTTLSIEGGIITDFSDAGCAVGTTMIVRELFYNTPARMKFLKKDVSEGNFVAAAVEKLALEHKPKLILKLIHLLRIKLTVIHP